MVAIPRRNSARLQDQTCEQIEVAFQQVGSHPAEHGTGLEVGGPYTKIAMGGEMSAMQDRLPRAVTLSLRSSSTQC